MKWSSIGYGFASCAAIAWCVTWGSVPESGLARDAIAACHEVGFDEASASDQGWIDLCNGKDVSGWTRRGGGEWAVENGVLIGSNGPGHLYTDETFADFELRCSVRVNTRGNSGIYFRARPREENPDTWPVGYEAQVDHHDPKNFTGCIYNKAWPKEIKEPLTKDGEWFEYRVMAVGDRIRTWVNDVLVVDAQLGEFREGHIALQTHHPLNRVEFKDLRLRRVHPPLVRVRAAGEPIKLFFCTHSAGFRHDVLPEARAIMQARGEALDWLDVEATDDITGLNAQVLAGIDVVMLYTSGALPLDAEMLADWVAAGGALVGVHSATDTLAEDGVYPRLIGAIFDGHPWNEEVELVIDAPDHPAMAPFMERAMRTVPPRVMFTDEIYQFRTIAPDITVLMSLAPEVPKREAGREYPLVWTREPGKGRVFYTALGHRPEVWRDEVFVRHLLEGVRWAARE